MTDRKITSVKKDDDGNITSLCHWGQYWSPRPKNEAIRDIEFDIDTYFVDHAGYRIRDPRCEGRRQKTFAHVR